jgi:hypothetical protein
LLPVCHEKEHKELREADAQRAIPYGYAVMALQSLILAGNARLDRAALGPPSIKAGPPPDDVDAVRRIQRTLRALGFRMPKSFPNGTSQDPDGIFGPETHDTVVAFQRQAFPKEANEWDGRVGPHTLAKMDEQLPKPAPPSPFPPGLLTIPAAKQRIREYLTKELRRDVADVLLNHEANLIVFGETHFTFDDVKSALLSALVARMRLRQPVNTHFHGSERFPNDAATRNEISTYVNASPARRLQLGPQLSSPVRPFTSVLEAAAQFPNRRYGILPIDTIDVHGEDARHESLFKSFTDSALHCPDVPFGSINSSTSRGNLLLGARHASRRHVLGRAAPTTCARLIDGGWKVHAVRLTVPLNPDDLRGREFQDDLNLVLRRQAADHTPIDVLEIAQSVAGGKPFYADLTKPFSPFFELRHGDAHAADIAFNSCFDALVHVPAGSGVPLPVF